MQSSTGTFLRGVILVLCVVVVPLAALFGGNLPDGAKDFLHQQLATLTEKLGGSHSEATTPAGAPLPSALAATPPSAKELPPFAAQWPDEATKRAPSGPSLGALPPMTPPSRLADTGSEAARMPAAASSGAIQASYEERPAPGWPAPPANGAVPRTSSPSPGLPNSPPPTWGAGSPATPLAPETPGAPARAAAPVGGDRLGQYQSRLRELGVGYHLLETWGDQGQLFRCYCRVAVAGNPACSHYFDAVDADPLAAMAKVVQQVEAWRAAGR